MGEMAGGGVGKEEDKPPYRHFGVAVLLQDTYHVEEMFMEQWQQFQPSRSWLPNWCPPVVPFP